MYCYDNMEKKRKKILKGFFLNLRPNLGRMKETKKIKKSNGGFTLRDCS